MNLCDAVHKIHIEVGASEVCLIQLKLQDKHAARYDAQIGSGYSVEVSDLF